MHKILVLPANFLGAIFSLHLLKGRRESDSQHLFVSLNKITLSEQISIFPGNVEEGPRNRFWSLTFALLKTEVALM